MGKRRTISYRDTARLALVGGILALVTTAARLAVPDLIATISWLGPTLGTVGVAAWFLATAAGLLALSTPYRTTAIAGLVLCAITLVGLLVIVATSPDPVQALELHAHRDGYLSSIT